MIIIIIAILGVLLDQLSKYFIADYFVHVSTESIPLIKNVLYITYTENEGAAFGMFQGARYFFIIVTFLACCALVYWLIKNKNNHILMKISAGLIIAGGIGNLIDRLFLGYVRDFIHVNINFAIFNIADSCVVVGSIILGIYILFIHDNYVKSLLDVNNIKEQNIALEEK